MSFCDLGELTLYILFLKLCFGSTSRRWDNVMVIRPVSYCWFILMERIKCWQPFEFSPNSSGSLPRLWGKNSDVNKPLNLYTSVNFHDINVLKKNVFMIPCAHRLNKTTRFTHKHKAHTQNREALRHWGKKAMESDNEAFKVIFCIK